MNLQASTNLIRANGLHGRYFEEFECSAILTDVTDLILVLSRNSRSIYTNNVSQVRYNPRIIVTQRIASSESVSAFRVPGHIEK